MEDDFLAAVGEKIDSRADDYKPLLSIYIPSYNRPELFRSAIQGVLDQRADLPHGDIELVLCSDASPIEATNEIGREAAANHDHVSFIRMSENHFIPKEHSFGYLLCRGYYYWILSDDDPLRPEGLKNVYESLKQHLPAYLTMNWMRIYDHHSGKPREQPHQWVDSRSFPTGKELLATFGLYQVNHMSCQIWKRSVISDLDKSDYLAENPGGYYHIGYAIETLWHEPCYYLGAPVCSVRVDKDEAGLKLSANLFYFMTVLLARTLEICRARTGHGLELYEQVSATPSVMSYHSASPRKLSDNFCECILRSLAFRYRFTLDEWRELTAITSAWRPAAVQAFELCGRFSETFNVLDQNLAQFFDLIKARQADTPLDKAMQMRKTIEASKIYAEQVSRLESASQQIGNIIVQGGVEAFIEATSRIEGIDKLAPPPRV